MNKIAVTSDGPSVDDQVDPRFGRAGLCRGGPGNHGYHYIDNGQSQVLAQGAGIQATELVARAGVNCCSPAMSVPRPFRPLRPRASRWCRTWRG